MQWLWTSVKVSEDRVAMGITLTHRAAFGHDPNRNLRITTGTWYVHA